jgi:hypothetical protein
MDWGNLDRTARFLLKRIDYTSRGVLGGNHKTRKYMKFILLLISVVTLLVTAGCTSPGHRGGGEGRGREEYRKDSEHRSHPEPGVDVRIHAE